MIIYNRNYKIQIIFEYNLKIFHEEILIINIIKIQERFFHLKIIIDLYIITITQVSEIIFKLNINI